MHKGSSATALRPLEAWEIDLVTGGRSSNDNAIIYVGGDGSWNSGGELRASFDTESSQSGYGGPDPCDCSCHYGGTGYGDYIGDPCYGETQEYSSETQNDQGESLSAKTEYTKAGGNGTISLTAANGFGSGTMTLGFSGFDLGSVGVRSLTLNLGGTSFTADLSSNRYGVGQSFSFGGGINASVTITGGQGGAGVGGTLRWGF